MALTLIANSGIQLFTFPFDIEMSGGDFKLWFQEWYDKEDGELRLDLLHEIRTEDGDVVYVRKKDLFDEGFLAEGVTLDWDAVKDAGIQPVRINDENCRGVSGDVFKMTFADSDNKLADFENKWLPLPYFHKKTPKRFAFGALNWARFKLMPVAGNGGRRSYTVLLALDTRVKYGSDDYLECPVFPDNFQKELNFEVCTNEFMLMDYCSSGQPWSYIDSYLMSLVHPEARSASRIKGDKHRNAYAASYFFLIDYIAQNALFPSLLLCKDEDVEVKDVDMIVDIGNSRTTALLVEDNSNFNQICQLGLLDLTNPVVMGDEPSLRIYKEPFDMRLAFRKADFGEFGLKDSRQFVYPSFVRLGEEANELMHKRAEGDASTETLSTCSSPKRYLWDSKPNKEEWAFLVLEGEADNHILNLRGLTNQLKSDGSVDAEGKGGLSYHYSRRSLMTFAFLEMLVQAKMQINSDAYRTFRGSVRMPRKIRRIVITCPTAMSKLEREAMVKCAKDAVVLLDNFGYEDPAENQNPGKGVDVVPAPRKQSDDFPAWYYDEATCAQLVYMYAEVAHKYKGCCEEFFSLYGKRAEGASRPSLTVGSLDIGAGTSDLMICKYDYAKDSITTISPDPLFYDSFYYAGDDMLKDLIRNVIIDGNSTAIRKRLQDMPYGEYRQRIKDFFGPDHNDQSKEERLLRRDFNLQVSVPLMHYFLELLKNRSKDCTVRYKDVFAGSAPNSRVLRHFEEKFGMDFTTIEWEFSYEAVASIVAKAFEPLLKKIAAIMYAYSCDVVILSGRPSSLPPIGQLFLKYYAVSPNRLILLNNYYVGDWYPFGNNTDYITNPKTIVAVGAMIGHYASELSNLNDFVIDIRTLGRNLRTTINYVSDPSVSPEEYCLTPDKHIGKLPVSNLPVYLNIRQIDMDSYPSRALFTVDYNRHKIAERLKRKADSIGEDLTDAALAVRVKEETDRLRKKMPVILTLEREAGDLEAISVRAASDCDGNDIQESSFEICIQSLGVHDRYWLDTGAFDF